VIGIAAGRCGPVAGDATPACASRALRAGTDNPDDELHEHAIEPPDEVPLEPLSPHPGSDPVEVSTEPRSEHPERHPRPARRVGTVHRPRPSR
jgi:hypothetical protein